MTGNKYLEKGANIVDGRVRENGGEGREIEGGCHPLGGGCQHRQYPRRHQQAPLMELDREQGNNISLGNILGIFCANVI